MRELDPQLQFPVGGGVELVQESGDAAGGAS